MSAKVDRVACTCKQCGKQFLALPSAIKAGRGKHCSRVCSTATANELRERHGHAVRGKTTRTYNSWASMIARCHKAYAGNFERYGGAGISVCDRWRKSFDNFLEDMGERPDGMTLDRIDSSGNYTPENTRWLSVKHQQRNRKNNVWITFNGETLCREDWAKRLGMGASTLEYRLRAWPLERALTPIPRASAECAPKQ